MTETLQQGGAGKGMGQSLLATRAANTLRYSLMNLFILAGTWAIAFGGPLSYSGLLLSFFLIGYVDELFGDATRLGVPMMRAHFPRSFLDVNREPYELDPRMFEGRLPPFANTRSLRVAGGLGTIARVVGDAREIYDLRLPVDEAINRIEIRGAAYGTLSGNAGSLFTRPEGVVRSVNTFPAQTGGTLRFSNVAQETPIQEIWGYDVSAAAEPAGTVKQRYLIDSNALPDYTNLDRLRRYIEDDPANPQHLVTVRGIGYRFIANP